VQMAAMLQRDEIYSNDDELREDGI
jgi:hypothetical protein